MQTLNRMTGTVALGLMLCFPTGAAARPNVLLVMTDDQGYPDLSCHGNPVVRTPALDRLHDESHRLIDFHVAPMCTPTRGQLLTGLDALRNRAMNVSSGRALLKAGLPTLADHLSAAGYATGLFGKWHLGDNYPFRPQDRGFDEALWFPSSHINSTPDAWDNDYFDDVYRLGDRPVTREGYCTDVFFREAMDWIDSRPADKPWLAYIALNAPHWPWFVPNESIEPVRRRFETARAAGKLLKTDYPAEQQENIVRFLAMIENIDANMGLLEAFLRERDLVEDTLVIFLTDNGSTMGVHYFNAGMRGNKTQLWEGGHRVPCFLRYPGGDWGSPRDVDGLTQVQDLVPTILELCGAEPVEERTFDGQSLVPVLAGETEIDPDRTLLISYTRMPTRRMPPGQPPASVPRQDFAAVMKGPWRLLNHAELYNLDDDPLQTSDVAADHPQIVADLRRHQENWWKGLGPDVAAPERVVIGSERENPADLSACEWLDVFIDQQVQVRRGERKSGVWHLQVETAGDYLFELRRWPEDCPLGITAGCPPTKVTDGTYVAGEAIPIAGARIDIDGTQQQAPVNAGNAVRFEATLDAGPVSVQTWFLDADGNDLLGAYYLKVERKAER